FFSSQRTHSVFSRDLSSDVCSSDLVGTVMAISGAVAAWAITSGYGLAGAVGLAIGAGLLAGLWNGCLVAIVGIQPIVATLILMTSGRGIAQLITEGRILTFSDPNLAFAGSGSVLGI